MADGLIYSRCRRKIEKSKFVPDKNIICVYEETITFDDSQYPTAGCTAGTNDRYALYQETAEKNILLVNMLFVNQETGDFYNEKTRRLRTFASFTKFP